MEKLVTVTNKDIISFLSEYKDITLLYPLKDFCVGYEITFDIDEINGFILINRILNNKDIDKLSSIFKFNKNNNIKGIIFDDIGVLDVIKNMNIIKILLLNHVANNYETINYYLEYVDSIVVSNDITKDEIELILNKANKPLVLNVFGLNNLFYSRRLLLSNFNDFYNKELKNIEQAKINDKEFIFHENEYGTVIYAKKYYNGLELLNMNNVLYYWYNPLYLDKEDIINIVINNKLDNIDCDNGFLYQKTIYKLSGDQND